MLREAARRDIDEAIGFYVAQGASDAAIRFIDQVERALHGIAAHPQAGSTNAHELSLPGLRFRSIDHFPYLVFYVEHPDHVDVWRILHGGRDIAEWLRP